MTIDLVLIISLIIVILRILVFLLGSFLERSKGLTNKGYLDKAFQNKELPLVSVVVPARNEENNIEACIRSIAQCEYGNKNFEIIAVNDRSSDKTGEILSSLSREIENLKVIDREFEDINVNLQGKPGALQAGIERAMSDRILMTDADCTVHKNWIKILSSFFDEPQMGLVAGYTAIKSNSIFDKIQEVEWTYMHTLATAGVGLNMPLSCYGNNLAVRKEYFDEIGGYYSVDFSVTEDLALLQAMHKAKKKIRHVTHEAATVTTIPCPNLKEYLKQHHRWAIGALDLGYKAFLWVITSLAFWIGFGISIYSLQPHWIIGFLIARIIGDAFITIPTSRILKVNKISRWMIPSVLFFLVIELIAPLFLLKRNVNWKGQNFK